MPHQASFFSSSSSSSSISYAWTYDVFPSFRGSDTRYGFTGNLYKTLRNKGIHTFFDDRELPRGEEISPSLVKAIQESRMAIVVFSKNYASSSFCLEELATIMECVKGNSRLVLPVFYDVDPSDVRHQRGSYGEAMAKLEERFRDHKQKLQKWRQALYQAANLSGEHFKLGNGYEHVFIEEIVKVISNKINRAPLHVADYPVGLESRMLEVKSLLNDGFESGSLMVGIHGIGGIGKTTIARAVFNLIADQFEGLCFLENVREKANKHGLECLQEKLLYDILGDEDIKLYSIHQGIPIIKHRLHRKKVLLVLDDVNHLKQLQSLVGEPHWFGYGSRVIITTRDKHLLERHGIERKYEVHGLNKEEALALLGWNAFKDENIDPSYSDILKRAITYANGLPLALEVIGSNLFGKNIRVWRSALDEYEIIPDKEIQEILKVSFDGLGEYQKKIFLDIACCFNGYKSEEVQFMLHACYGVSPEHSIDVLVQKSLLKIDCLQIVLHDLIRDMGKEIVRQESPEDPGNRSRLWFSKDIVQVLEDNSGSSKIEIVTLDAPKAEKVLVDWDGDGFKKMRNLKILIIRDACFSQGATNLPNSLRVLEWHNYPSNSLLCVFHPKKPVIFNIPPSTSLSSVDLVEKRKFTNLKVLSLDESDVEQIPDVSNAPNLEKLTFRNCENLTRVDETIGSLKKLVDLGVSGCNKLKIFPSLKLPSLEGLYIYGCPSLENFPEILGYMDRVKNVFIHQTLIKDLPSSFKNLRNLECLEIEERSEIMLQLPSSIFSTLLSLQEIKIFHSGGIQFPKQDEEKGQGHGQGQGSSLSNVASKAKCVLFSNCNILDESIPTVLAMFRNVETLDLSENNFTYLPESIKELCYLKHLCLDNCKKLEEIGGIPPNIQYLSATYCMSINALSRSMLLDKELHSSGRREFQVPGSSIPKWFEHIRSKSNSISFWFRNNLPPFSLCFITTDDFDQGVKLRLTINGKKLLYINNSLGHDSWFVPASHVHILYQDDETMWFKEFEEELVSKHEWNHVVYTLESLECGIKEFGIQIHKEESNMEDIRFTEPLLYQKEVILQTTSSTSVQGYAGLSRKRERSVSTLDIKDFICKTRLDLDSEVDSEFVDQSSGEGQIQEHEALNKEDEYVRGRKENEEDDRAITKKSKIQSTFLSTPASTINSSVLIPLTSAITKKRKTTETEKPPAKKPSMSKSQSKYPNVPSLPASSKSTSAKIYSHSRVQEDKEPCLSVNLIDENKDMEEAISDKTPSQLQDNILKVVDSPKSTPTQTHIPKSSPIQVDDDDDVDALLDDLQQALSGSSEKESTQATANKPDFPFDHFSNVINCLKEPLDNYILDDNKRETLINTSNTLIAATIGLNQQKYNVAEAFQQFTTGVIKLTLESMDANKSRDTAKDAMHEVLQQETEADKKRTRFRDTISSGKERVAELDAGIERMKKERDGIAGKIEKVEAASVRFNKNKYEAILAKKRKVDEEVNMAEAKVVKVQESKSLVLTEQERLMGVLRTYIPH